METGPWFRVPSERLEELRSGGLNQGSYASGKCQGIFNFFKVRELSGNFMMCQGKVKFCQNVRELSGNFAIPVMNAKKARAVLLFGIQAKLF